MEADKMVDLGNGKKVVPGILYGHAVRYEFHDRPYEGEGIVEVRRMASDLGGVLTAKAPEGAEIWECDCGHEYPALRELKTCPFCGMVLTDDDEEEPAKNGKSTALTRRQTDKMISDDERRLMLEEAKADIRKATVNGVRAMWELGAAFHIVQREKLYQLDGASSFNKWVADFTAFSQETAWSRIRWFRTVDEEKLEAFCKLSIHAITLIVREIRGALVDGEDMRAMPLEEERRLFRPIVETFVPEIERVALEARKPVSPKQAAVDVIPAAKKKSTRKFVHRAVSEPAKEPEPEKPAGAGMKKPGRPPKVHVPTPDPVPVQPVTVECDWLPASGVLPYLSARSGRPVPLTEGQTTGKLMVFPLPGTDKAIRFKFLSNEVQFEVIDHVGPGFGVKPEV